MEVTFNSAIRAIVTSGDGRHGCPVAGPKLSLQGVRPIFGFCHTRNFGLSGYELARAKTIRDKRAKENK